MTRKSRDYSSWQPMIGADPGRLQKLGQLLMWRRAALGHSYRPSFLEEQDVNGRMVADIEKGRRDTYTGPTLEDLADAYAVTYDSMLAVAWGRADELTPAADTAAPPRKPAATDPLALPPSPFGDPGRDADDRPYALAIWKCFLDLPRRVTDPDGAQMFPGDPDDAKAWDSIAGLPLGDRVWVVADMRRRADGRAAPESSSSGA